MNHLKTPTFCTDYRVILIAFVTLLFYSGSILLAQETSSGKMKVYPSLGIAAGFFNPVVDVNDYITESFAGSGISTEFGTTDIFANFEIKGGVNFRLKRVDFSGELAFAIAPKWVIVHRPIDRN